MSLSTTAVSVHLLKTFSRAACAGLCLFFSLQAMAGGGPPGDGDLQIVFGDDGAGGTAVTATGTGQTDDTSASTSPWLGFSDEVNDRDLVDTIPAELAALLATMGNVTLTDTISFTWTGGTTPDASPALRVYDRFGIDQFPTGTESFGFTEVSAGMGLGINGDGAVMSVTDGVGTIPLPFSTFASVHGMSFPSGDGFTFLFELPTPPAATTSTSRARPDLLIGKRSNRLKGDNVYNQRKPSGKQTLNLSGTIFVANTSKASLLIQNDGGTRGDFRFKTSGDKLQGMKIQAFAHTNNGRNNISGELKRSSYNTKVAPGGSQRLSYELKTSRFWAGARRNGERENNVIFRLSGGSHKDHAGMVTRFRE